MKNFIQALWSKRRAILIVLLSLCVLWIYSRQNETFRTEDVDDALSASFIYNYTQKGIENDPVFDTTMEQGQSGVRYFGKIQAMVYGRVLDIAGWTRGNFHWISVFFFAMSALLWFFILKKRGSKNSEALVFCLLLLWLEPLFYTSHLPRTESFVFFLVSCSILFYSFDRYFLSALVLTLAIENHPIAFLGGAYLFAFFIADCIDKKRKPTELVLPLLNFLAGLLTGAGIYMVLHRDVLDSLSHSIDGRRGFDSNFFLNYFFFQSKRRLLEVVLFGVTVILFFWSRQFGKNKDGWILTLTVILFSVIIGRNNPHDMFLGYPALLYFLWKTYRNVDRLDVLIAAFLLIFAPKYLQVSLQTQGYRFPEFVRQIQATVPKDSLPVFGNPNSYFALMDRDFYSLQHFHGNPKEKGIREFYLIADNTYRDKKDSLYNVRPVIETDYRNAGKIGDFTFFRQKYEVYRMVLTTSEDTAVPEKNP